MCKFTRVYCKFQEISRVSTNLIMTFGSYFGYYYAPPHPYKGTNIYIRGLSPAMNDDDLFRIVAEYGNIVSSKAIIDLNTGVCKGYGFAMFEDSIQAGVAMEGLKSKGFSVSFAVASPRDNTVFIMIHFSIILAANYKI